MDSSNSMLASGNLEAILGRHMSKLNRLTALRIVPALRWIPFSSAYYVCSLWM